MMKSARVMGKKIGITAPEMNMLLKRQGYLDGEPGEYYVTEKGVPYAEEQSYSYQCWSSRTWDDAILEELDTSPETIQEVRGIIADRRQRQKMEKGEVAQSDIEDDYEDNCTTVEPDFLDYKAGLKVTMVTLSVIGFVVAVPHIKTLWQERVKPACKKMWCQITRKPYQSIEPGTDDLDDKNEQHIEGEV